MLEYTFTQTKAISKRICFRLSTHICKLLLAIPTTELHYISSLLRQYKRKMFRKYLFVDSE